MNVFASVFGFLLIAVSLVSAQEVEYLTPSLIDVGEFNEGQLIEGTIKFRNPGNKPLLISDVKTSCGCTVPKLTKREYLPGETGTIDFTIKTTGFSGVIRKSITVLFENPGMQPGRFIVQAKIHPEVNLTPRYLNFTKITADPDTTVTEYIELENNSDKSIHVSRVESSHPFISVRPGSIQIPPHKSQLFAVEVRPVKMGRFRATINLATDNENKPTVTVPVFIYITKKSD